MGLDELLADQQAGGVTGLGGLGESYTRAHEERLDGADRDPERCGEVGIRHPDELTHEECRALLLREAANVFDQAAERLPQVDLHERIVDRCAHELKQLRRGRRRAAELVDAAVVSDPEEPGPEGELLVGGAKPGVGAHEHVLEGVLSILAPGEHLARVCEQPLVVALMDGPEGLVVAGAEERHELLVGAEAEQRHAHRDTRLGQTGRCLKRGCCGSLECGRFHLNPFADPNEASRPKFLS
jgi:hypothetical protein